MFEQLCDGQQNKHGFTLFPKLLHPQSVGTIRLKSKNPFDYPSIDPKYLEEEADVEVLLDGIYYDSLHVSPEVASSLTDRDTHQ